MSHRKPGKRTLTLNKQRKKLLGVCARVADYLDVEPWSVRLVFLISIMFGGWFLIPIYFIAWFCLDDKPEEGLDSLANTQPLGHQIGRLQKTVIPKYRGRKISRHLCRSSGLS